MENLSLRSAGTPNSGGGPKVCSISREGYDKVKVIGFSESFFGPFRGALQACWTPGIQNEGIYGCAHEFKLRGRPWSRMSGADVPACRLIIGILRFMLSNGWVLQVELSPSYQMSGNMDSWFFRKGAPEQQAEMCALGFKGDKLRIIDANQQVSDTVELAIQNFWHLGLQQKFLSGDCDVEFKLKGYPWRASRKEKTYTDAFVMHMMEELRCIGWNLYVATDAESYSMSSSSSSGHAPPVKSWILKKLRPSVGS